jgi:hypothetical protein
MSSIIWDVVLRYGGDMGWLPIVRSDGEEVFRGEWARGYLAAADRGRREMFLRMNERPADDGPQAGISDGLRLLYQTEDDGEAA